MTSEDDDLQIELLLEAIRRKSGHDFRNYARASLTRRIHEQVAAARVETVADLIPKVLNDRATLEAILARFSITVTEMFRDPGFFVALRDRVVPVLRTYPRVRLWVPGCSTGQEVYSLAILLEEEGLYDRARIYATDFNPRALAQAKDGVYSEQELALYEANYRKAGGERSLAGYLHTSYARFRVPEVLKRNIVFARHNLATDASFSEVHLVVCRNVLIYFDRVLQDRVIGLFADSLYHRGHLALGPKETLQFTRHAHRFEQIAQEAPIYRFVPAH